MKKPDYAVDASGGGDFKTIQEAVDAAEKAGLSPSRIKIKRSSYSEQINLKGMCVHDVLPRRVLPCPAYRDPQVDGE